MSDLINIKASDIESIREFLNNNFREQITNQMIAEKFHYHAYYLNRVFKESFGVAMHKYIIECRINEAMCRLKEEDTPIGVIAIECGFKTSSYFSRHFKAYLGVSPSEYRNKSFKE